MLRICCLLIAFVPGVLLAEQSLSKGVMLLASERVTVGPFNKSVILIIQHDGSGTVGLEVNRPSKMQLARLLPDHGLPASDGVLYLGGPVEPKQVLSLTRTKRVHPAMMHVLDDVYLMPGLRALTHIAGLVQGDERVRGYTGYSGWAQGQLAAEIKRGDWVVIPGNSEYIFSDQGEGLWERLYRQWAGQWI